MTTADRNFSDALATWKDINLSELQKILDIQGLEIVENQKESVLGRKALAERTKEFKKIPDDEKLGAWKVLLKSYQTEIDSLTKRSKTSENAFLSLYKKIAEAPDPFPLLDAVVEQTVKASQAALLEVELAKLRDENAALTRRVNDLSSSEVAKKKLDARVQQLEEDMEDVISEKVTQRENELNATYDEKMRNYEDREQDLVRQLALAKSQLRDLRTSNETNQAKLLDQSQRQDEETIGKLAELDMVVADLERANNRVATVERRNELLRAEIESVRTGSDSAQKVKALETQIADLSLESERLSRVLETQKLVSSGVETQLSKNIEEISKELSIRNAEIESLKQRLVQFSDYDEIKRELQIMKYVEFAGLEEGDASNEGFMNGNQLGLSLPNPNAAKANTQQNKTLEVLLAAKNIRIMEELTKFRVLHGELECSLNRVSGDLENTKAELEKQKVLNDKLETDLLSMEGRQPNGSGLRTPAENGTVSKDSGLLNLDLGGRSSATLTPTRSTPIPFQSSADTSILPIVTSQRDRFRQRNAELEEELRKQFQIISDLRTEVKSLQADNLKLYEKVRYMQSYRDEAASSSTLNPLPAPRHDDLSKYHARYEEAMNPFEAFRGREAARAFQALNPVEKAVLTLTRAILGNRRARNMFIFYALALHLLVMFTTYECTTNGTQLQTQPAPY